ncbi:MAG: glycosyltransferase [Thermoanaerobaculia bacterium]|nr:glycosyltransferase [Thermoanaerobaculia bacterium]
MSQPDTITYSVVIPTCDRLDVLPEVLAALAAQGPARNHGVPPFEVVVVDDGSTDGTWPWLEAHRGEFDIPIRIYRQENAGPAKARNWGVTHALGDRLAFLGDDTVPDTGWLASHHHAYERRRQQLDAGQSLAVIGYTCWHERMRQNPFLRYINEYGLQFGYALIDDPENVPFNFLYTSNLTLPRQALLDEPFDLGFPYPAWEDIELSYRLTRAGLRIVYEPNAVARHDHPTDLGRFTTRQEKAGYSAVVFHRLHPELGPFLGLGPEGPPASPPRWRQLVREWLARSLRFSPVEFPGMSQLWDELFRWHYIQGLHRGWRDRLSQEAMPFTAGPTVEDATQEDRGDQP